MKRVPRENEATLLKSASINLGEERFMLVLFYYKGSSYDRSKNLYRCCLRIDSKKNWMRIANDLRFENPAEPFNTSMIGLPDSFLLYHHRRYIKSDMARWLRKRFFKFNFTTMEKFVGKAMKTITSHPFLLFYDIDGELVHISDISRIPEGKWFVAKKIPRKKRTNKIIF